MNTSTRSNWKSWLRAFYVSMIVIAALWAMPKNGRAQIYVTNGNAGSECVSEYKTTGELINAKFITGLHSPTFLAIHDNDIFVSNSPGFPQPGFVGKYDVRTGGVDNPSFIVLSDPFDPRRVLEAQGLAVLGDQFLYVVAQSTSGDNRPSYVNIYSAIDGEAFEAITESQTHPYGIAVMGTSPDSSSVFVAAGYTIGSVDKSDNLGPLLPLITQGLIVPTGLALLGNTLFVANSSSDTVGAYNANTGAVIKADFLAGLHDPRGLAVSGDKLFVVNGERAVGSGSRVGAYDATTGAVINADLITGLHYAVGIAVRDLTKKHKK
jgi:hypothetical protein